MICIINVVISCGVVNQKDIEETYLFYITIKNQNEGYAIVSISVEDMENASLNWGPVYWTIDKSREGKYLVKINFQDNNRVSIIKKLETYGKLLCKNNIIGLVSRDIQFLRADNYEVIKTIPEWNIHDFTADRNRLIVDSGSIYEYDDITKTKTILKPFPNDFLDAKYCPTDETVIAYIGASNTADNMTGDIYLINNDATGNTLVLSGYNALKLCWHPDGNRIIFATGNSIYSVNKDGSNVVFVKNHNVPADIYFYLYYNLIAYIYPRNIIVTEKFSIP
ncbi:MAG: hypothetical protein N3E50_03655 [Candidatus Goldbacteria bacterium]|nr:hypothetical protein [Candidatus Goldiibacteriota bacterium]